MSWLIAVRDIWLDGIKKAASSALEFIDDFDVTLNEETGRLEVRLTGGGGGGSGDVVGPASSVDDRVALFSLTTGKLLKQSAFGIADLIKRNGSTHYTSDQAMGNNSLTAVKSLSLNSEVNNATNAINWTAGAAQKKTANADATLTFTAPAANTGLQLRVIGDGTPRTYTWPAAVTWLSGSAPTIASGVGVSTLIGFWYDGTTYWGAAAGGAVGTGDIKADGTVPFAADQSMGGNKLTNLDAATDPNDATRLAQVEALIAAAVAGASGGGGDGFVFTFSTTTTDADPGAGLLRFNNATPGSVTQLFVDLADVSGNDVTAWLDRLDDAAGSVKGYIRVASRSAPTKWHLWSLQSVTSATGYRKLNVTYVAGGGGGLPNTTASDTFLSFESLGVIGELGTTSIADDAITFAKLLNATAAGKIVGSDAAGNFKEMGVAGGIERSGTDFIVSSQLPARGTENVVVDLYPSTQQQGTLATANTLNFDVAIASGRRYKITADVWVDDGAGGAVLFTKSLLVNAHQTGGAAVLATTPVVIDDNAAAGWAFTVTVSGTNVRFQLANTSGSTRSYNIAIGFWSMDKP